MIKYLLFLDDERDVDVTVKMPEIYDDLQRITARNFNEFIDVFERNGLPEVASLDMDLHAAHYKIGAQNRFMSLVGYEKCDIPTGLDCMKYLVKYCQKKNLELPKVFSHSMNHAGRQAILAYAEKYSNKKSF